MGILQMPQDPGGIFPDCSSPPDSDPSDLRCDADTFRNYAGVEANEVTEPELQSHIDSGHLAEFDTMQELNEFVGATPDEPAILNKLGLIVKIRNGIKKARMILDTKASGVKAITTQAQRINLPRLFDSILQISVLLTFAAASTMTGIDV